MSAGNKKELWLQDCLEWFSELHVNKWKFGASAIVHTGSSPVFVVFSYAFSDQESVKPKLTANVSEKKVITVKFPWESIGGMFLELMCLREFAEEMNMTV